MQNNKTYFMYSQFMLTAENQCSPRKKYLGPLLLNLGGNRLFSAWEPENTSLSEVGLLLS